MMNIQLTFVNRNKLASFTMILPVFLILLVAVFGHRLIGLDTSKLDFITDLKKYDRKL